MSLWLFIIQLTLEQLLWVLTHQAAENPPEFDSPTNLLEKEMTTHPSILAQKIPRT